MKKCLVSILLFLCSCGSSGSKPDFRIALDPQWYALELPDRKSAIQAFSVELIEAIAKEKNLRIELYDRSWDNLVYGLTDQQYEGILSTMQPYLFYEKMYDFSDLYLPTGPTLVIPASIDIKSLDSMAGKEIAIQRNSNTALILEKHPGIIQRTYDSIPAALVDVANGTVDGAMVDILTAYAYCTDLFQGRLKIALPPLTHAGVRLVTLHNKSPRLISAFNDGLQSLKENGTFDKLAKKWNLIE